MEAMNYYYLPSRITRSAMSSYVAFLELDDSFIFDSHSVSLHHRVPPYRPQTQLPFMTPQGHNSFYTTTYPPVHPQSYNPQVPQVSPPPPPPLGLGYNDRVYPMQPYTVHPRSPPGPAYNDQIRLVDGVAIVLGLSNESSNNYEDLLDLEERMGHVNVGLSKETISKKLKTSRVKDIEDSGELCAVCQDEYNLNETIGTLHCGHHYHAGCINQWLLQKNECPICKAKALIT